MMSFARSPRRLGGARDRGQRRTTSLSTSAKGTCWAQRMMPALQSLPLDTQVLLELRYFHTMSTAELAALYQVPSGTIKSRLSRAREALETAMDLR